MFNLLANLYHYVKKHSERKLTLVVLGLDNAGKTTCINTIRGEIDKEVTPTFGFNASTTEEGKYKVCMAGSSMHPNCAQLCFISVLGGSVRFGGEQEYSADMEDLPCRSAWGEFCHGAG